MSKPFFWNDQVRTVSTKPNPGKSRQVRINSIYKTISYNNLLLDIPFSLRNFNQLEFKIGVSPYFLKFLVSLSGR